MSTTEKTVLTVRELPKSNSLNGRTVTFHSDIVRKVSDYTHGLHDYPAKYIPQIPKWAINYSKLHPGDTVLDPFCGSGTTLVEARLMGIDSYGIDINPLARLLAKAKVTPLCSEEPHSLYKISTDLLKNIAADKDTKEAERYLNLHSNWRYWYDEKTITRLAKIKYNIENFTPSIGKNDKDAENLKQFFLICFSSILKKCSYFDEKQIKVLRSKEKFKAGISDPYEAFKKALNSQVPKMVQFTNKCLETPSCEAKIIGNDAKSIHLPNDSIDLVVTSPPYINAIDYPFAHKYNLLILGLLKPDDYRPHSRDYIGVSERVLLKKTYNDIKLTGDAEIDFLIKKIYDVDKIRAYIMWEYFTDMRTVFKEVYRVLDKDGKFIIVVGSNYIRKNYVPTHLLLKKIAEKEGLLPNIKFFHRIQRRFLGIPRNHTGGVIRDEMVAVFKKA